MATQKGVSTLRFGIPTLPPIPYSGDQTSLFRWVERLYIELELHFSKIREQLVDSRGIFHVDTQVVANGFTIEPTRFYVDLRSGGVSVTSHATLGISKGVEGQGLIVTNLDSGTVTIVTGGIVFTARGGNISIPQFASVSFRWDDSAQHWVQIVVL